MQERPELIGSVSALGRHQIAERDPGRGAGVLESLARHDAAQSEADRAPHQVFMLVWRGTSARNLSGHCPAVCDRLRDRQKRLQPLFQQNHACKSCRGQTS